MWMFEKSFENIDENDIRELITRGVSENQNLEYKERSYGRSDEDKRELLRDVTSIANAYGGYLILGIREDESGIPIEITGVENAEDERDRTLGSCLSSIEPRITGFIIKTVSIENSNPVILIYIPRSTRAPHMVTFGGLYQFWIRHDRQKSRMSVEEIREAFLRTENIRKDIEEFIKDRKKEILDEIEENPTYVIGAAPIMVKEDLIDISDNNIRGFIRHPPSQRPYGWNLDFVGTNIYPKPTLYGLKIEEDLYGGRVIELFRNGYLELRVNMTTNNKFIKEIITDEKNVVRNVLNAIPVVEYAVSFYRLLKALVEYLGLNEPFVGFLSLYNINGFRLERQAVRGVLYDITYRHLFDVINSPRWLKTHLELPPMQILSFENPDRVAKDFLDRVWNAFGYEGAPSFTHDGRFQAAP